MFEDLDKFIAENSEEILVTAGRTDDKISELETQLDIAFREEVKIFIRKYGVLIGYGVEIVACGLNGHSRFVEDTLRFPEFLWYHIHVPAHRQWSLPFPEDWRV